MNHKISSHGENSSPQEQENTFLRNQLIFIGLDNNRLKLENTELKRTVEYLRGITPADGFQSNTTTVSPNYQLQVQLLEYQKMLLTASHTIEKLKADLRYRDDQLGDFMKLFFQYINPGPHPEILVQQPELPLALLQQEPQPPKQLQPPLLPPQLQPPQQLQPQLPQQLQPQQQPLQLQPKLQPIPQIQPPPLQPSQLQPPQLQPIQPSELQPSPQLQPSQLQPPQPPQPQPPPPQPQPPQPQLQEPVRPSARYSPSWLSVPLESNTPAQPLSSHQTLPPSPIPPQPLPSHYANTRWTSFPSGDGLVQNMNGFWERDLRLQRDLISGTSGVLPPLSEIKKEIQSGTLGAPPSSLPDQIIQTTNNSMTREHITEKMHQDYLEDCNKTQLLTEHNHNPCSNTNTNPNNNNSKINPDPNHNNHNPNSNHNNHNSNHNPNHNYNPNNHNHNHNHNRNPNHNHNNPNHYKRRTNTKGRNFQYDRSYNHDGISKGDQSPPQHNWSRRNWHHRNSPQPYKSHDWFSQSSPPSIFGRLSNKRKQDDNRSNNEKKKKL